MNQSTVCATEVPQLHARTKPGAGDGRLVFAPILGLTLTLIAALWGGTAVKIAAERTLAEESLKRDTLNLARAFEAHATRTISSADQSLRILQHQYMKYGRQIDIAGLIRDDLIIGELFNQMGIIDENGTYILSSLPRHKPLDLSDREHFRVHRDRVTEGLWVSRPALGRTSGKWSIQLTRRIDKPDGSFGGVAAISIDTFYFTSLYNEVAIGKQGIITVVGLDGIVRARRTSNETTGKSVGRDISSSQLFSLLEQRPQGHYITTSLIDGVERILSFRKIEGLPLAVVVGVGREEALADYLQRRNEYLLFAGLISLIVLLFGLLSAGLLQRQRHIATHLRVSQAKAESANRLKSDFLASMSHELRTPLNGIIDQAELIRNSADTINRERASIIHKNGRHLLGLVNDILDQASIEAGRLQLNIADCRLDELLDELLDMQRGIAEGKGLELQLDLQPGLPISLSVDRKRLLQILDDLLHNALKFTSEGHVRLNVHRDDRALCFAIEDSGPGIPLQQQEAVFERFRQLDGQHSGTGLGLALARELAGMMGGEITLTSAPGKGSTFTLRLPLQDTANQ